MSEERGEEPVPRAVMGAAWKVLSMLGLPAITLAAGLWRDVALQAQTIEAHRVELVAQRTILETHLEAERRRLDAAAEAEKNTAVDRAKLGAALDNLKGQIDALLASLNRRRPG